MNLAQVVLIPTFASFLAALLVTPLVIYLAKRFGFIDDPKTHKHPAILHTKIIPRAGGLALYLAIIPLSFFILPFDKKLLGIAIGATLAVIIGVLDDKRDLNPYLRLGSNFLVAAIAVASGIGISFITNPFGGVIRLDTLRVTFDFFGPHSIFVLADIFAIFWIAWVMNMLNWSKGVDGQMPGIAAIVAFVLGLLALRVFED